MSSADKHRVHARTEDPAPQSGGASFFLFARRRAWWVLLLAVPFFLGRSDEASRFNQFQLKAAYLYSFAKYVNWPSARFSSEDAPLVIGVGSRSPVCDELEQIVQGRSANGHRLVLRICESVSDAKSTHILFVQASDEKWLLDALPELKKSGVLCVGESNAFAEQGGMLTFVAERDRLRFKVNLRETRAAGLTLSSQLLKLAIAVTGKEP